MHLTMKNMSTTNTHDYPKKFTFPESTDFGSGIGCGCSPALGISTDATVGYDTSAKGIMPNPGKMNRGGASYIWIQNSCAGIEVILG
jgi:hypothetical protein